MGLNHQPNKLEDELCFAIYTAQKNYNKFYTRALGQYHLTYPQYITLLVLWDENEPMMIKELGARLKLDTWTLTPLLKRMEREGWIARQRGEDDARKVYITTTPKAKDIESEIKSHMTSCFRSVDMTEQEYADNVRRVNEIADELMDE